MLTFCQLTSAKLQHYVINPITLATFCLALFYYWFILLEITGFNIAFCKYFQIKTLQFNIFAYFVDYFVRKTYGY